MNPHAQQPAHTAEPWRQNPDCPAQILADVSPDDTDGIVIGAMEPRPWRDSSTGEANAARAVACWNALRGLNPDGVAGCVAVLERFAEHCRRHSVPELQGIACDAFAALAKLKP